MPDMRLSTHQVEYGGHGVQEAPNRCFKTDRPVEIRVGLRNALIVLLCLSVPAPGIASWRHPRSPDSSRLPTAATTSIAVAARSAGKAAAATIFTSQSAQCEIPGFPGNAAAFDPETTGLSYCPAGWGLQIRSHALDAELWRCGLTLKVATTPQDAQQLAGRLRNACERTNAIMDSHERAGEAGTLSEELGGRRRPARDCRCPASYFQLANSVGTGEGFYGGLSSGTSSAGGAGGTSPIDGAGGSTGSPAPAPTPIPEGLKDWLDEPIGKTGAIVFWTVFLGGLAALFYFCGDEDACQWLDE